MLRLLLGGLVAANLLFFGFTLGWFDGVLGLHSAGDREPERLAAQVRPQSITLLPPATGASTAAASTTACYETALFSANDAPAAEAAVRAALPPGSWTVERSETTFGSAQVVNRSFRVAAADPALAAQLTALKLDAFGRGFSRCANPAPGR